MPNDSNIQITRGDSKDYALHFTDANGADIVITGWTIFFTASDNPEPTTDTNAQIKKTVTTHTDATHGRTTISLTPADTNRLGDLYYDIQVKKADGKIITVLSGLITFNPDQTIRTA